MNIVPSTDRPPGVRRVPLLHEPEIGHYPEFASFLAASFDLAANPFGPPGLLQVDGRFYEMVFTGRSGRPFPDGVELSALVPGLEPLDVQQAERDLWVILQWLVAGAGEPWSTEALDTTGRIYRISALEP